MGDIQPDRVKPLLLVPFSSFELANREIDRAMAVETEWKLPPNHSRLPKISRRPANLA